MNDGPHPPLNLDDYEDLASEAMPRMGFDYYAGGSDDEHTLYENQTAYSRIALHYRVLVDVSRRDPATTVLGTPLSMPIQAWTWSS